VQYLLAIEGKSPSGGKTEKNGPILAKTDRKKHKFPPSHDGRRRGPAWTNTSRTRGEESSTKAKSKEKTPQSTRLASNSVLGLPNGKILEGRAAWPADNNGGERAQRLGGRARRKREIRKGKTNTAKPSLRGEPRSVSHRL